MQGIEHRYEVMVKWKRNTTARGNIYRGFERSHEISALGKPPINGSADPAFFGDSEKWNPEELLVASLAACHKLWFLGLCAKAGVLVTAYDDTATGIMVQDANGAGQFLSVDLNPRVVIPVASDELKVLQLHHEAHANCFIARSVNFAVNVNPIIVVETTTFAAPE